MACKFIPLGTLIDRGVWTLTNFKWVFWINIPTGLIVIVLVVILFPRNIGQQKISRSLLAQIDWPGVLLSLGACILAVFPLEEGGTQFAWNSAIVIVLFIASVFTFAAFITWEWVLTKRESIWKMVPIFPTRLVNQRIIGSTMA